MSANRNVAVAASGADADGSCSSGCLAELHARDYLDGDRSGGDKVDHEAKRWPPASVCDEMAAVLPEVLEPVRGEAEHEQPWRSRDRHRGDDDEGEGEAALD